VSAVPRREGRIVLAVAVAAFAARVAVGLTVGAPGGEGRGYLFFADMADRLLEGEGLAWQVPTDGGWRHAHRTPLYPLLLAGVQAAFGRSHVPVVLLHSLLAALSVIALHRLGRRLVPPACAVLAAGAFASYPYCVGNDPAYGDQPLLTLATLLLLIAADAAMRAPSAARWALVGALGGACVLTRATWLPGVLGVAVLAAVRGPGAWWRRVALGGWVLVGLYLVGAPWLVRNAIVVGRLTWTTDRGRAFWIGNNDHTFDAYPRRSIDESEVAAWLALPADERRRIVADRGDEVKQDARYLLLGLDHVAADPVAFLGRGVRKVAALYDPRLTPDPDAPWKGWLHTLSYGPALLLAVVGLLAARDRRGFAPWLALVAGSVAVAFGFWGQTRLRVSLDPPMLLLSAAGLAALPGARRVVHGLNAWLARTPPGAPAPTGPT
jgi:4-amino-4-deoxy-L-arabinose transferase-like glycosyltransferase